MNYWIDIEDNAGSRYGSGPIITAQSWESTTPVDKAGTFRFSMPASDPKAGLIAGKRVARCYTVIQDVITEVGAGIIDKIRINTDARQAMLEVSGDDLLRELTFRQVSSLTIGTALVKATTGPANIIALAPPGWSLDIVTGNNTTLTAIYHSFEGETVLSALCKLAELTGEHFRLGAGRTVVWMQKDQTSSGIRAVQTTDPGAVSDPLVCIITGLTEEDDSYQQYSRIYPYGAGEGTARKKIDAGTSWTPPDADWVMDTTDGYIKRVSAEAVGRVDAYQNFKDIKDDDVLAGAAYEWLRTHSSIYNAYDIGLAKLDTALPPGGKIRCVYHRWVDGYQAVNIDADLYVLETTTTLDTVGLRTSKIKCSTVDRHAVSSASAVVGSIVQATNFFTHAQPIAGADVAGLPPSAGDVTGPAGAVSGNLATFNGATGKVIQDGGVAAGSFAPAAQGVTNGNSHDHAGGDGAAITEAALSLANNTTADVATTQHGFVPIAPNDGYSRLLSTGLWGIDPSPFGDGSDGDATIGAGTTTLTKDKHYHNLTLNNAASILKTAGFSIYVSGKLTLVAGAIIDCTGGIGVAGTAAGGAGAAGQYYATRSNKIVPRGGATGASPASAGTANGTTTTMTAALINSAAYAPPFWRAGGGGGGGAGHGTTPGNASIPGQVICGAIGGAGGAGTGVGSTQLGGGGGGGGGGVLDIYTYEIDNAGTIQANGGAGGDGAVSGSDKAGNGGGGGGGEVLVLYRVASGSGVGTLQANGGAAGVAGNGGVAGVNGYTNSFQI
jgi:hypothetical protein